MYKKNLSSLKHVQLHYSVKILRIAYLMFTSGSTITKNGLEAGMGELSSNNITCKITWTWLKVRLGLSICESATNQTTPFCKLNF